MRKLVARFEMTTPSFLGGMESNLLGLRGPSLRGVLRFWWRTLMFSRYQQDLLTMRQHEDKLFGSSAVGTGQVQFLPVQALTDPHSLFLDAVTSHDDGLTYLAYGVKQRQAIAAPLVFDLPLVVRSSTDGSVREALILLGMLGGIGARSRRGWGSLSLQQLEEDGQVTWQAPQDRTALEAVWRGLAGNEATADMARTALPPFTVLSSWSRIYLLETGNDALTILNHVGEEFQRYRSFGRHGKVAGRPAEQNFRQDHDLMLGAIQQTPPTRAPERTIFGLPHNYWFSSTKRKASVTSSNQRRASPLFLHVQKMADTYAVIAGILPAVFIPDKFLKIKATKSYNVPADLTSYYPRIEQFVTGTHPQDHTQRFPQEVSLWP